MKTKQWLSSGNSKYADSVKKVLTWGIPALRSKTGLITCPGAGFCASVCYAQQGRMAMSNCTQAQENRLKLAQSRDFVPVLLHEMFHRQWDMIRIHDVGDFYEEAYLRKWLAMMAFFPDRQFFAYTKMVPMFKKLVGKIPTNFHVVFSLGGKWDSLVDLAKDNHSRIFETKELAAAAGYEESPDEFPLSMHWARPKEALVYHGCKNFNTCLKGKGGVK